MKRHVVVVVLLLAGVVGLAGQQDTPRFRAGVELARLDIEVTDAQGRAIEDLRPEEVEIIEDGQRHPVVFFQHVHELAGSYEEAARRTIGGDVSTNQGAPNGRLYVLVFDQAHITAGNEQRARLAAEQFVRARIRPGDRVALYGLPGPGPQVGFTSDIDRVIAELENISGSRELVSLGVIGEMRTFEAYEIVRGNRDVRQRVTARMAEALGRRAAITEFEVEEDARSMVNRADFRARQFLESLAELLRGLRRVEGRKEIVLLSEGFYDDNLGRELEQVAAAAAQSYGIVYGIDLNRRESSIRDFASLGAQRFSAIQSRVSPLGRWPRRPTASCSSTHRPGWTPSSSALPAPPGTTTSSASSPLERAWRTGTSIVVSRSEFRGVAPGSARVPAMSWATARRPRIGGRPSTQR